MPKEIFEVSNISKLKQEIFGTSIFDQGFLHKVYHMKYGLERRKLIIGYLLINGKIWINRKGYFNIQYDPDLKYLLKKNKIKQERLFSRKIGFSYITLNSSIDK